MHYERLSALDASFVAIEDVNTHMHVAAALIFEPGDLATRDGGLDMERIRAYVDSRLHLIPRYRQRLEFTPFERHPVWVDDHRFNLFYHVRHTSLPRPGSDRQFKRLCGRIMSQKLDVTKPLWEIWIVEGLGDGRFALVAKTHHCMIDGMSGVDLLAVLLSLQPTEVSEEAPPWSPRRPPTAAELAVGELRRRLAQPMELVNRLYQALGEPRAAVETVRAQVDGLREVLSTTASSAAALPINPPQIGPHRRFDWVRFDLDAVKEVKTRLGGTINDVVLATVVAALRRFLRGRGVDLAQIDFRAMIPVSIRQPSERGALGNRVAEMIAPLSLAEADPRRSYAAVVQTTEALKESHQVEASGLMEELSEWTASALLAQMIRLAARRRAFNLVVTNVPGPPVPLYLLGARLLHSYPMVPLFTNQALGIALFSYAGGLYWGLNADWDTLPDLHDFAEALEQSFRDLHDAAIRRRAAPAPRVGKRDHPHAAAKRPPRSTAPPQTSNSRSRSQL